MQTVGEKEGAINRTWRVENERNQISNRKRKTSKKGIVRRKGGIWSGLVRNEINPKRQQNKPSDDGNPKSELRGKIRTRTKKTKTLGKKEERVKRWLGGEIIT